MSIRVTDRAVAELAGDAVPCPATAQAAVPVPADGHPVAVSPAVSPRKARRLPDDVPRRPRRAGRTSPAADRGERADSDRPGPALIEQWPDGDWVVRQVPGAAAVKLYRCPGCDQEIAPGTAHLVVWPADGPGPEDRRHWHNACWRRRPRRPGFR